MKLKSENDHRVKLNLETAIEIANRFLAGETLADLAADFGFSNVSNFCGTFKGYLTRNKQFELLAKVASRQNENYRNTKKLKCQVPETRISRIIKPCASV
jgi:hypothetical protein